MVFVITFSFVLVVILIICFVRKIHNKPKVPLKKKLKGSKYSSTVAPDSSIKRPKDYAIEYIGEKETKRQIPRRRETKLPHPPGPIVQRPPRPESIVERPPPSEPTVERPARPRTIVERPVPLNGSTDERPIPPPRTIFERPSRETIDRPLPPIPPPPPLPPKLKT
jgi:hypothetical protein